MRHPPAVITIAAILFAASCFELDPTKYVFEVDAGGGQTTANGCVRSCTTPPTRRCIDSTTLEAFPSRGQCTDLTGCGYTPVYVRCGTSCHDGGCVEEPCAGVFCDRPPASKCDDASHLRIFDVQSGVCTAAGCTYQPTVVDCPGGCQNGVCTGNLCAGKVCESPPSAMCLDDHSLRHFSKPGTCTSGLCSYLSVDSSCANGCAAGLCLADPCSNIACNQPPADICADSKTRRVFAVAGACNIGRCIYGENLVPCAANESCTSGRCVAMTACNAASCATGCCEGANCITPAAQNDSRCGVGASVCGSCGTAFKCTDGVCQSTISCAVDHGGCSPNAMCSGSGATRVCSCNSGFSGDGFVCKPVDAGSGGGGIDGGTDGGGGSTTEDAGGDGGAADGGGGELLAGETCELPIVLTNGVLARVNSALFSNQNTQTGVCSPLNGGNDVRFTVVVPGMQSTTVRLTPSAGLDTSIGAMPAVQCNQRACEQASSTGGPGSEDMIVISNDSTSPVVWSLLVDSAGPGGGEFTIVTTNSAIKACASETCSQGCCLGNRCVTGTDKRGEGCGMGGAACSTCASGHVCRDRQCQNITGDTGGVCRVATDCYKSVTGSQVCNASWPNGGYCTNFCLAAGQSCGAIAFGPGFCTPRLDCLLKCAAPGMGKSSCANGYLCDFADRASTASQGVCVPDCHELSCQWFGTCQPSGYCRDTP